MSALSDVLFEQVSFCYAGSTNEAMSGVDLAVRKGEFLLVAGSSGSGKTTLARCINGLVPHFYEGTFSGTVCVAGKDTREHDVGTIGIEVGSVFQDPRSQFFMMDVASEVAFGCANNVGMPRNEVWSRVGGALRRLGIEYLRDRRVFELSSGEMQQVAVASNWAMAPSIYVFDEPSANLDMDSVGRLARIMAELKREGRTVVVFEHRLFYLKDLFDRLVVMEGGAICRTYGNAEAMALSDDNLASMGLRSFHPERRRTRGSIPSAVECGLSFEVEGLSFSYRRFGKRSQHMQDDRCPAATVGLVSFRARGGEVVGVVGSNGSGKTTLARLCCGLAPERAGTIELDGCKLGCQERLGTVRLIMQDSDCQLFGNSVLNELSIGRGSIPDAVQEVLKRLELWDRREDHPAALSRGQKQRLTIASALVDDSRVFFFDEPTSGLDEGNMRSVASLLRGLAQEGRLVFVISHDYEFLLAACSRVIHLEEGRLVGDFSLVDEARGRLAAALWKEGEPWRNAKA